MKEKEENEEAPEKEKGEAVAATAEPPGHEDHCGNGGRAAEARRTMIGREEENWPDKMSGGQRTAIPDRE